MKKIISKVLLAGLSTVWLILPFAARAAECSVEPFSTTLRQGESVTVNALLPLESTGSAFEVKLGNLPYSVEGGFSNSGSVETVGTTRKVPILIQAKADAQTGSFMVAVSHKSSVAGTLSESICQMNLIVEKRVGVAKPVFIQNSVTESVSSGLLPLPAPALTRAGVASATSSRVTASLSRGARGPQVLLLQELLQRAGFFPATLAPTGYYGVLTEFSVKLFQLVRGIEPLGLVGPQTRSALSELSQ